jgi:hypothetical protein
MQLVEVVVGKRVDFSFSISAFEMLKMLHE